MKITKRQLRRIIKEEKSRLLREYTPPIDELRDDVNDTMFHILQSRLPFGGVGQSGHGCFHGYEGFLNFSHLKSIYYQTRIDFILSIIRPPRGKAFSLLSKIMKKLG